MSDTGVMEGGSGSGLSFSVLLTAGIATAVATIVSTWSICSHLKNYRKPALQRMVIRIMVMVPLYGISSYISLFSLEAGVIIDVIRDVYEAFVIYCFFHLLLIYLGGERSLLILLYGREPKQHAFPVSLFKRELDASDPFTFLFLRRGILQYVQVKPVLAAVTLILKALGKYREGAFRVDAGYLYVSIIYNASICLSLYCLAMFWVCVSADLKPFRPMPKFLCVKGILFFSFWQSITISFFVSIGLIKRLGPYTDVEHISLAITDTLICYEMPLFAIAHSFAFATSDFTDPSPHHVARMPFLHALRDAFGLLDVVVDARATLQGGVTYKAYEPAEGGMHQGTGRDRRIRAGLRYAAGGKKKYWLPMPADDSAPAIGPIAKARRALEERYHEDRGYAPLTEEQEAEVVHSEPSSSDSEDGQHFTVPGAFDVQFESQHSLAIVRFRKSKREDAMYDDARKLVFGDYNYPVIDCSSEAARARVWEAEEGILRDQRAAAFDPNLGGVVVAPRRYGATDVGPRGVYGKWADGDDSDKLEPRAGQPVDIDMHDGKRPDMRVAGVDLKWTKPGSKAGSSSGSGGDSRLRPEPPRGSASASNTPTGRGARTPNGFDTRTPRNQSPAPGKGRALPPDAVDLVVEDPDAAEKRAAWERRKGDPALRPGGKRVYRRGYVLEDGREAEVSVEEHERRGGSVDQTRVRVQSLDQDDRRKREEDETDDKHGGGPEMVEADTTEVTVARASTPPPQATVITHTFASESSLNQNPWA
ncbi:Organic solute transporter Ostalpha [Ceratobasidium sp. AG-Ba]|nr:Organic solute transporter Ostalpha [Ceratobasidium sp. AG-Ba]QRW07115.1 Organic solute transporter Ostalpha [Ceratobasidium sp. AG-Ba]